MTNPLIVRIALGTLLLVACSPGGATTGLRPGTAPEAVTCTASVQSCYCPDGTSSGTQSCDPKQGLGMCVCPAAAQTLSPSTSTSLPMKLCSTLQGNSACQARSYASQQVPSSILFVVDRSGSMACNAPPIQSDDACDVNPVRADPSQPSKWETTTRALGDAFGALSGTTASIGLSFFSSDDYCGADSTPAVELAAPDSTQLSALSGAMSAASPSGGTPIVGAVISAYHHLHEELHAPGNRYVVLITDGAEDCGTKGDATDEADLAAARERLLGTEVEKAREANIKTFVIGSPGSEKARGFLSELAYRGGTARSPDCLHSGGDGGTGGGDVGDCHFDLTKETDFAGVLKSALGNISGKAVGCVFQTPPGDVQQLNVQYSHAGSDPVCLPQDDASPCDQGANGWQFAKDPSGNDDTTHVVLCGQACDAVKADPTTVVDVVLGCPIIM